MANEISVTTNVTQTNGSVASGLSKAVKVNQASAKFNDGTQHIATSYQAVAISADITTAGYAIFLNTDATNYIELGVVVSATFYPFAKLLPGEPACFRVGSTALYAKANTAAADLRCYINAA